MTTIEEGLKKASLLDEVLKDSEIPKEAQAIAKMGAIMGASNDSIIQSMVSITDSMSTAKANEEIPEPQKPKNYTKTESMLHDMLIENTGIAMMDSGGTGGRAWQRNRSINDFRLTDAVKVEIWGNYRRGEQPSVSKNTFHFLNEHLTFSKTWQTKFKKFGDSKQYKDSYWLEIMEDFAKKYNEGDDYVIQEESHSVNTYNFDNCLNQTLQYVPFIHDKQYYIILQIHGGADVRGGYTDPKVFECDELDSFMISMTDLRAACDCIDSDSSNSGYTWDPDCFKDGSWNWSKRLQGVYCKECKTQVNFS